MPTAGPCFEHDAQSTFGLTERVGGHNQTSELLDSACLVAISELSWSQVAVDRQLVIALGVISVSVLE